MCHFRIRDPRNRCLVSRKLEIRPIPALFLPILEINLIRSSNRKSLPFHPQPTTIGDPLPGL